MRFSFTLSERQVNAPGREGISMNMLGISTNRAAKIEYAPEASRVHTFNRFPSSCRIDLKTMAQAGKLLQSSLEPQIIACL